MAGAFPRLVSNDYNSDSSSKYDPSDEEETHNSYNNLHQPEIDDDDWAEEEGDYESLTPQEITHRLSNKVSTFFIFMPYKSIKCVFIGSPTILQLPRTITKEKLSNVF